MSEMESVLTKRFAPDSVAKIPVSHDGFNSDLFGSAEYRANLVTIMAKRAIAAAVL
jgi:carbon-monoxide dehydrogenase medium subunit